MTDDKKNYVILDELPEEQREPLEKWLVGQTLPAPPEAAGRPCCWRWDYERWLAFWLAGKTAPVLD